MFILDKDGIRLLGAGVAADAAKTKFTWRGTKIGGGSKMVCPAGMKGVPNGTKWMSGDEPLACLRFVIKTAI